MDFSLAVSRNAGIEHSLDHGTMANAQNPKSFSEISSLVVFQILDNFGTRSSSKDCVYVA